MRITDILNESMIVTGLKGGSKQEVINALVDLIGSSEHVLDKEKVREAIFDREKLMSTGVGDGFALPHGKTDAVANIVAAFAVTESPIDYDALDKQPVRLIFLLVGKDTMVGPHIKLLSRISRLMNKEQFRNHLLTLKSSREVLETFRQEEATYFGA